MPAGANNEDVFHVLQEHTKSIARIDGELGALTRGMSELKTAGDVVSGKLDRVVEAIAAFNHRPQVPSVSKTLVSLVAAATLLGIIATGMSYWFSNEFEKHAKDLSARIDRQELVERYERKLLTSRLDRLESFIQVKPAFRDWVAELR